MRSMVIIPADSDWLDRADAALSGIPTEAAGLTEGTWAGAGAIGEGLAHVFLGAEAGDADDGFDGEICLA